MSELQDITLKCKDCGKDFVFTTGEQEFFAEKGLTNQPQRCLDCRRAKKQARNNDGYNRNFGERKPFNKNKKFD